MGQCSGPGVSGSRGPVTGGEGGSPFNQGSRGAGFLRDPLMGGEHVAPCAVGGCHWYFTVCCFAARPPCPPRVQGEPWVGGALFIYRWETYWDPRKTGRGRGDMGAGGTRLEIKAVSYLSSVVRTKRGTGHHFRDGGSARRRGGRGHATCASRLAGPRTGSRRWEDRR